jgi:hypothetical protein
MNGIDELERADVASAMLRIALSRSACSEDGH